MASTARTFAHPGQPDPMPPDQRSQDFQCLVIGLEPAAPGHDVLAQRLPTGSGPQDGVQAADGRIVRIWDVNQACPGRLEQALLMFKNPVLDQHTAVADRPRVGRFDRGSRT